MNEQTDIPSESGEVNIRRQFSYSRIILVVLLSLLLSGYLIYTSFDFDAFRQIGWAPKTLGWIAAGALLFCIRHLGYMYRLRLITGKALSWRQSFNVISLWEFSSAVTPSTVGGAAVAIWFLKKEKLSLGKSAATSMLTIFLDQLFLAIGAAIMFLVLGSESMFASDAQCRSQSDLPMMSAFHNMRSIFLAGYFFFLLVILLLAYGLFINAHAFKRVLSGIFSLPFLRRWKDDARQTGDDMILTSVELKAHGRSFWWKALMSTTVTWTAFFLIPVCIIYAFFDPSLSDVPVIFSRMFALWMLMLLPISPGGAGIAELAFSAMMCDFTSPALVATLALLWRLLTYYPYLIAGVIILPRWINKKYRR